MKSQKRWNQPIKRVNLTRLTTIKTPRYPLQPYVSSIIAVLLVSHATLKTTNTMSSEPTSTQSQPRTERPTAPTSSSSSSQPKVDVTIDPTSHLDPGAYVRGTLPIKIGKNVLIHQRVYLLSIHSPLTIGDGCIIGEKAVLGGPAPTSSSAGSTSTSTSNTSTSTSTTTTTATRTAITPSSNPTVIHSNVHIHPSATIDSGATIKAHAIIESNARVCADIVVGSHSKVSAGVCLSVDVPDWTVVWGSDGDLKRRSRRTGYRGSDGRDEGEDEWEVVEKERLKAMDREREGTMMILSRVVRKR